MKHDAPAPAGVAKKETQEVFDRVKISRRPKIHGYTLERRATRSNLRLEKKKKGLAGTGCSDSRRGD